MGNAYPELNDQSEEEPHQHRRPAGLAKPARRARCI